MMRIGWTRLAAVTVLVGAMGMVQGGLAMVLSPASAEVRKPVKIVLVGDSTVNAEGGWGKGFCAIVTARVTCVNEALNGRSTKSFIDEGAWAKALADHGDYYLIQFGHNDQKPDVKRHTDPDTTYAANLRRFISDVRAMGGVPVILTPLSRRNYKDGVLIQDLTAYANAARHVAEEENVTLVDLNAMSVKVLEGMTQAQADEFDAAGHPDAKAENKGQTKLDRTHLNAKGQAFFGRMVADELVRERPELKDDVVATPSQ